MSQMTIVLGYTDQKPNPNGAWWTHEGEHEHQFWLDFLEDFFYVHLIFQPLLHPLLN